MINIFADKFNNSLGIKCDSIVNEVIAITCILALLFVLNMLLGAFTYFCHHYGK